MACFWLLLFFRVTSRDVRPNINYGNFPSFRPGLGTQAANVFVVMCNGYRSKERSHRINAFALTE